MKTELFVFLLILQAVMAFPAPTGYVNDFAGVIDASSEAALESRLAAIESETGVEFAVVTVPDLEGDTIEGYAVRLFEEWGIGKAKEDNGILLLIAVQERKYRFEVGYGLEGALNDAKVGRIGRETLVPHFQSGDYAGGISAAVNRISGELDGSATNNPAGNIWEGLVWLFWYTFPISAIVLVAYAYIIYEYIFDPPFQRGSISRGDWMAIQMAGRMLSHGSRGFGGGRSGGGGASGGW